MEEILIDGLCYTLDAENLTAKLVCSNDINSNEWKIKIPAQVQYEQKTYKVTSIGYSAFANCESLISITIPDSVNKIESGAWCSFPSLKSIIVDPGNPTYDSRDNCQAIIETASNKLIAGCLNTIIPDSVTSIGASAFLGSKSLRSITIPDNVTSIGSCAFLGCNSLTSINIPDSVTEIGHSAFHYCFALTSISLPNSVTKIGDFAFGHCSALSSITIPDSVTEIGDFAFSNCSALSSITIPDSVTEIGLGAFSGCSALTSLIVDPGNPTYDSRDNCQAIIETASNKLIAGCQKTVIPNSVTEIGYSAFRECNSLTSITIPDSVTTMGNLVFCCCESLRAVTIPKSVKIIGEEAFLGCSALTSIIVDPGNPTYDSRNNCQAIIETASNELIAGCQNTVIPNSVTSIGPSAFFGCESLRSITLPDSVTYIGFHAFEDCYSLTSITIPDSVTEIGHSAFANCKSLISITFPNGIKLIDADTFFDCESLTSINIPDSVTEIGPSAFFGCKSLTSITLPEGLTYIGWHAFLGNDALTAIDYHGTKEQWQQIKKHDEWNDSPNIQVVRCRDGVLRL